jgi:predicted ATPase/class 3 adenylate cyclase
MRDLPTGTVTFLFSDIEGSTRLVQRLGEQYGEVLDRHAQILRQAIMTGGGIEVGTEGDSFFATFPRPAGAVTTAVSAQRALATSSWSQGYPVRVRMGLHTGQGVLGGDNYIGLDIHVAARIAAAGHGGQVLISEATQALVLHSLPEGVSLRDLGRHRLKDIEHPEHLYDLVIEGLPAEFPAIRTIDARPTNLPLQRTSFVGRAREVAEVTDILSQTRLLTLTGPGGTGKTRLALKVAADHLDRFSDGVFFVDLSPIADPSLVPSAIAQALVVRGEPGRDLLDMLADHLRDRQVLLVLDNSEQVIEAGLAVARLLDISPRLTVLVTSRIPLRISGETEYQVPPLAHPESAELPDLDLITSSEAVALFTERAAAVQPGFRITEENAVTVAEITARLDGLPLAIELAASRLNVLSPDALLARLGQRLSLLTGGARDLPERHRTLLATISWSHDLLSPEEQRLFARLAVFSGGWTLESAEIVCQPGLDLKVLQGLGSLVDHSLVRRMETQDGEVRFSMLDTIREFSTDRLSESDEVENIRARHLEYMRDLLEEAEPQLVGEAQAEWLRRLDREHDNLRAALDWAARSGDAASGLRAASAVWRFWQLRGYLSEARTWLDRLLKLPGAEARDAVRARALGALGSIAYWQNDYEPTREAYEEAVDIAREIGDTRLLVSALQNLFFIPALGGDFERAESILDEAMPLAEELDDPAVTADLMTGRGFLELWRGNPSGALEPYREAIAMLRRAGNRLLVADNLTGLGAITRMLGDSAEAKIHFRESLEMFVEAGSIANIPQGLTGFALVSSDEGMHERTARLLGASARIRDETGGGAPPELLSRMGDPESDARKALGDEAFEWARAEGYAMSTEAAVAYALSEDDEPNTQAIGSS